MDFVSDELFDGRRLRLLTIVDHCLSECNGIDVGQRFRGKEDFVALARIGADRTLPKTIRVDNGSEFTSNARDRSAFSTQQHLQTFISKSRTTPRKVPQVDPKVGPIRPDALVKVIIPMEVPLLSSPPKGNRLQPERRRKASVKADRTGRITSPVTKFVSPFVSPRDCHFGRSGLRKAKNPLKTRGS